MINQIKLITSYKTYSNKIPKPKVDAQGILNHSTN